MKKYFVILAFLSVVMSSAVRSQDKAGHAGDQAHVVVRPDAIKWGPGPPGLPKGLQMAVLVGDPSKAGPFVLRAKLPDGCKIAPHWHSIEENVTVLKGTFLIGKGEMFDRSTMEELPAGSFMSMPKTMRHFATAKGETLLQVHGLGPFDITYVNADDDPRAKEGKK